MHADIVQAQREAVGVGKHVTATGCGAGRNSAASLGR